MEETSKYNQTHYSLKQLREMGLPDFPTTERGCRGRVISEGWEFVEKKARGRTGVRREYLPPPEVLALIEAMQRGEIAPATILKEPKHAPGPNRGSNDMRVAERRIGSAPLPPPKDGLGAMAERIKLAERALELAKAGINPDWLLTGEGPMRAKDQPAPAVAAARINWEAFGVILESTLRKFPEGEPSAVAKWAIDFYQARIDEGSLTPEGNGPGNLSNAA